MPCAATACKVDCKLDSAHPDLATGICVKCGHSVCYHCEKCVSEGVCEDGGCGRDCCRLETTVFGIENLC